jgi:hypothetical protein
MMAIFVTSAVVVTMVLAADKDPTRLTCNGRAEPPQRGSPLNEIIIDATIDYDHGRKWIVLQDEYSRKTEDASFISTDVLSGTIRTWPPGERPGREFKMLWVMAGAKQDFKGMAIHRDGADVLRVDGSNYSFQYYDVFLGILYRGTCAPLG